MVPIVFVTVSSTSTTTTRPPRILLPGAIATFPSSPELSEYFLSSKSPLVAVLPRRDPSKNTIETPRIACLARMIRMDRDLGQGKDIVYLQGVQRCWVDKIVDENGLFMSDVKKVNDDESCDGGEKLREIAVQLLGRSKRLSAFGKSAPIGLLCDTLVAYFVRDVDVVWKVLETTNVQDRVKMVEELMLPLFKENKKEEPTDELEERVASVTLPDDIKKVVVKEMKRLKQMSPMHMESGVIRSYIEFILDLPWNNRSEEKIDIRQAQAQLDQDHYGLQKVKKRIVEFLAVRKLTRTLRGPIMCLTGPPGIGKTSLGKSIAATTGRKFHRVALGGVRDEAEIRGHRRTYVGALPGLILNALKRVGTKNPVILLDEIDKIGRDSMRGDPAAALLEVLDPEQNSCFTDHYPSLPFDLSEVMFIATANKLDTIPAPLRDRMEVIEIPGYTFDDKVHIAQDFLVPKQIELHGLKSCDISMSSDVLHWLVTSYTREPGVRELERCISSLCRHAAVEIAAAIESDQVFEGVQMDRVQIESILGAPKYRNELANRSISPGVVTGLAWSSSGAGSLLFIEVSTFSGRGKLVLTGQLGSVMKESAQTAFSYIKTQSRRFQVSLQDIDVHIHFPAGAIPKDGPSAGIAITTAIMSCLTVRKCRSDVAMTGEITLQGKVLPVGGISQKLEAAHRGGIKIVIVPEDNRSDVRALPDSLKDLNIEFVENINQVLNIALEKTKDLPAGLPEPESIQEVFRKPAGKQLFCRL